jgi:hypothetical protein
VYTLPGKLRDIAYQNKRVVYDLLMKAAAETTLAIAADPKHFSSVSLRLPPIRRSSPIAHRTRRACCAAHARTAAPA